MRPLLAAVVLCTPPAFAGDVEKTIAQKDGWAEKTKMLEEKTTAVNTACGTKLTAAWDKASFPEFDPSTDRTTAPCRDVMNTLVAICAKPTGKEGVAKVSKVSCKFSTAGTHVKAEGGTLNVSIDPKQTAIVGLKKGNYSWKSAIEEIL